MRVTKKFDDQQGIEKLTITTDRLQAMLGCGRKSAVQIGDLAGARIQLGKRVLWNVSKVRDYVNRVSI